jgi:hypothetical protein
MATQFLILSCTMANRFNRGKECVLSIILKEEERVRQEFRIACCVGKNCVLVAVETQKDVVWGLTRTHVVL